MKRLWTLILKIRYNYVFRREEESFAGVEKFVLFAGYPRSGHSLVGALMDAHPEIIISHELDALDKLIRGFSYKQIWAMILENSRSFARKGRKWSGYSYVVKRQYQGRFTKLRVIGDKKGSRTTLLLTERFNLIEKLKEEMPVPVRIIHVVRNPFDNIVTRARKGNDVRREITPDGIRNNISRHFAQAEVNHRIISESGCHVLTIRHEELIAGPRAVLIQICDFLELEAPAPWLRACSEIVFEKPHKTRFDFDYPKEMIDEINKQMGMFPFFEGYTYND
ncbi:MAG TPA: sulfotransferase [Bacteroidales bacterium]|nr:sulfotransferase [Bacteroidales bacterium]HRZ48265.1 sulfotransferase [Bacteroidales bacterium]